MAKPQSLSVKLTLDNGKDLSIITNCETWENLKQELPDHYALFEYWAEEIDADSAVP